MVAVIIAVIIILLVGIPIAILVNKKVNGIGDEGTENKNVIVNSYGIDVLNRQMGGNQEQYFKGMSGEIPVTVLLNQGGYKPSYSCTQIIFHNVENGREIRGDFGSYLDIGRGTWAEAEFLHISENPLVSNRHCRIVREYGSVYLDDLQSRNHTYLNGYQVEGRMQVKSGDMIALGSEKFRITFC